MQIFGVNFKYDYDCFEPRFIYDPIQKIKIFDKKSFKGARCFLTVFYIKKSLFWSIDKWYFW